MTRRIILFAIGLVVCGIKGILLPVLFLVPGKQEKEDLFKDFGGLDAPTMDKHFDRVGPLRSFIHDVTNLPVEHSRAFAQLATKVYCGAILALTLALTLT